MTHSYRVGQILDLRSSPRNAKRPAGPCEVLFCLPHDRGPALYRIRSLSAEAEYVVEEMDLTPSAAVKPAVTKGMGVISIAVTRR